MIKNLYIKLTFSKFVWNISWISHVYLWKITSFLYQFFWFRRGWDRPASPSRRTETSLTLNSTTHFCENFFESNKNEWVGLLRIFSFLFLLKIHFPKWNKGEKPKIKFYFFRVSWVMRYSAKFWRSTYHCPSIAYCNYYY